MMHVTVYLKNPSTTNFYEINDVDEITSVDSYGKVTATKLSAESIRQLFVKEKETYNFMGSTFVSIPGKQIEAIIVG